MMQLLITRLTQNERTYENFVREWFLELFQVAHAKKCLYNRSRLSVSELSLVFVGKDKMKKLNFEYRAQNKVTDVLSFAGDGRVSMGELIFCMDVIKDKAKLVGLPVKYYLVMLMTHGFLHLLGYEHEHGGEEEREMFEVQNKIMRKVAAKLAPEYKTSFDVL